VSTDVVPRLSLILATPDEDLDLGPMLAALTATLAGESPIEIVVTGAGEPALDTPPPRWSVARLQTPRGMLVPDQWGVGLRAATGELVAFLSPDLRPLPGWWPAASSAIAEAGVAGAAGGIDLAPEGHPDAGVFLARYSAFLPRSPGDPEARADLPGEATIYRRDALLGYPDLAEGGFWEIRFHRRLLADGWRLVSLPQALALFHGRQGTVAFAQQRWRHATVFGAERVIHRGESRLGLLLRAPLVPFLLVTRILWRALGSGPGRRAIPRGLGPLVLHATAWAAGEANGALRAKPTRAGGAGR
jgi:hypothetical protein